MFGSDSPGVLVPIHGTDPRLGEWAHRAFLPDPLGDEAPELSPKTYMAVANARAALAALDATAKQLPNPTLFRLPALRREAQSTSALEGAYAPLAAVYAADEDDPSTSDLVEILNYVAMANLGFGRIELGQSFSVSLLSELQGALMRGLPLENASGHVREQQVVIGRRENANPLGFPVEGARFVPSPGGFELETRLRDLVDWMRVARSERIDPIVAAAMAHYQFEALHPFTDGNGRIGRYLIVLHLHALGVLDEPTLTVSPWFEERRAAYYDALLGVSARGHWDVFIWFFAHGIRAAAESTRSQMLALAEVHAELKEHVRASSLRADSAQALIDFAVANPSFTVRRVESALGLSYGRSNKLVGQLVELGILRMLDADAHQRRFYAPLVMRVLTAG